MNSGEISGTGESFDPWSGGRDMAFISDVVSENIKCFFSLNIAFGQV